MRPGPKNWGVYKSSSECLKLGQLSQIKPLTTVGRIFAVDVSMFKGHQRRLLILSPNREIPELLQDLKGVHWIFVQSLEQLKNDLGLFKKGAGDHAQEEIFVLIQLQQLTARSLRALSEWARLKVKVNFILMIQSIENSCFKLYPLSSRILILFNSEGPRVKDAIRKKMEGLDVHGRKLERVQIKSQVMVKKSVVTQDSPTGMSVQALMEGSMQDFSKSGALVQVVGAQIQVKDFVSIMYQNRQGRWISVESQVRWISALNDGKQALGVQFLAVNT